MSNEQRKFREINRYIAGKKGGEQVKKFEAVSKRWRRVENQEGKDRKNTKGGIKRRTEKILKKRNKSEIKHI